MHLVCHAHAEWRADENRPLPNADAVDCSLAGPEGLPWWRDLTTAPPGKQTWLIAPFRDTAQGRLLDLRAAGSATLTVPPIE
jgi:hypothetical protein